MVVVASGRAVSEPGLTFLGQGGATLGAKTSTTSPSTPPLTRPGTGLQAVQCSVPAVRWSCKLGAYGNGQCGSAGSGRNPRRSRLRTAVVSHSPQNHLPGEEPRAFQPGCVGWMGGGRPNAGL